MATIGEPTGPHYKRPILRPATVTFRDPELPNHFFTAFNEFRQLQRFCDVELCIGDTKLMGHRIILASGSPFLMERLGQSTQRYVEISDRRIDAYAVNLLIEFLYTSTICISQANVLNLCYTAQVFRMAKIEKLCCKFLKKTLSNSNVIPYLFFCSTYGYTTMAIKCTEYALANMKQIYEQDSFLNMTQENVTRLIDLLDITNTDLETDIIYYWVKHDITHRREVLLSASVAPINPSTACPAPHPSFDDLTSILPNIRPEKEIVRHEDVAIKLLELQMQEEITCPAATSVSDYDGSENDNALFAFGGTVTNTNDSLTDTGEKFLIAEQRWRPIASMPRKKSQAPAVVYNSKIYSIGGFGGRGERLSCIDVYDPAVDKWIPDGLPPLSFPRSGSTAVPFDDKLYVIGGYDGYSHVPSVEIFNFKTRKWKQGPPLQAGRSYAQAAVLNGTIFVAGGTNQDDGCLRTVEKLSELETKWEYVTSMNTHRSRPGLVVLYNNLYAIGGYNGQKRLNSVECYDAILDDWCIVSCLGIQRNSPGVAVLENCIYVVGGHDGHCITKTVEKCDPRARKWTDGVPMMTRRCDFALVAGSSPEL